MLVFLCAGRIVGIKMSQLPAETNTNTTQSALYGMQYGMLPLLRSLDLHGENVNRAGADLFQYRHELGRLTVRHAMELLHVRVTDSYETTPSPEYPRLESPESVGIRAEYQICPDGLIVPTALYSRLSFEAYIQDEGQFQVGRYIPRYHSNHTTQLESDMYGQLSEGGLARLHHFTSTIVAAATEFSETNNRTHLQLLPAVGE